MTEFDTLWPAILDVGRNAGSGGYRRYAWSDADLTLREWFTGCAAERGMDVEEDRNGNLWAWWLPPGWDGDPSDAFVTGSHLDSVPDGGAFDGPLGVVSAFAAVDVVRARGVVPTVPVAVVAFSDEEGARFGVACVGSQLSSGALERRPRPRAARHRRHHPRGGDEQGRSPPGPPRPRSAIGLPRGVFVELHVEQGRALDLLDRPIAVASAIWPHGRWEFVFRGAGQPRRHHPTADRRDPMLAYASSVLSARSCAAAHDAVATFGKVLVTPNGANAIPSAVRAWLDARAADEGTLAALVEKISAEARGHATADGIDLEVSAESVTPVVQFPAAAAGTAAAGAGASRRHPGAADAGRPRRRHPVGGGADGNAVRAQPHRGVTLADRVRRERRLQPRSAGAGRRDGRLGGASMTLVVRTRVARRPRRRPRADHRRRRTHHRRRDRRRPAAVIASARRVGVARPGQRPLARLSPGAAGAHPTGPRIVLDLAGSDVPRRGAAEPGPLPPAGPRGLRRDGAGRDHRGRRIPLPAPRHRRGAVRRPECHGPRAD